LRIRQHLTGELDVADTERTTATRQALPRQEEAGELPQGIEPEATRHHRVVLEVAVEEPEVRLDVERRAHDALAVATRALRDLGDAIEHQHRRRRQLGIARDRKNHHARTRSTARTRAKKEASSEDLRSGKDDSAR
jgi:hypothetical protein